MLPSVCTSLLGVHQGLCAPVLSTLYHNTPLAGKIFRLTVRERRIFSLRDKLGFCLHNFRFHKDSRCMAQRLALLHGIARSQTLDLLIASLT